MGHPILSFGSTCGCSSGHSNALPSSTIFPQRGCELHNIRFHGALELLGVFELGFHFNKYVKSHLNESAKKVDIYSKIPEKKE